MFEEFSYAKLTHKKALFYVCEGLFWRDTHHSDPFPLPFTLLYWRNEMNEAINMLSARALQQKRAMLYLHWSVLHLCFWRSTPFVSYCFFFYFYVLSYIRNVLTYMSYKATSELWDWLPAIYTFKVI